MEPPLAEATSRIRRQLDDTQLSSSEPGRPSSSGNTVKFCDTTADASKPRLPVPSSSSAPLLRNLKNRRLEDGPITIGVCAMHKKAHSQPMMEMLNRLTSFRSGGQVEFRTKFFPEETILHKPIEDWPLCEALIAFFSDGFPLKKVQAYAALRRPLVFNDLEKQEILLDRRLTYRTLEEAGVPVPNYTVFNAEDAEATVDDNEDYLQVNGVRLQKPIVEKPISGEDHNIYIYYPRSHGGGSKRLFRKVGNRSSQFYPDIHTTRVHDGHSYLYEELLQTEGTDVKVYAVGPEYAHAEARKSPVVDGKVMRNARGRETRYPVILTAEEKEIARKVVLAFGQTLCGFDILRSDGRSYVCDVNGWSFVKDSEKFWDDSANLFRLYCLEQIAPEHFERFPQAGNLLVTRGLGPEGIEGAPGQAAAADSMVEGSTPDDVGELLAVVAFTRHADRTPKQKLKFHTSEPELLSLIEQYGESPREEIKIKKIRQMEQLVAIIEKIVNRLIAEEPAHDDADYSDTLEKFVAVKQVLKAHPFHGINRKVQIKPTRWAGGANASPAPSRPSLFGSSGSAQAAPPRVVTPPAGADVVTEAQFILKWGGELTPLGEAQATALGARFRNTLYPGEMDGVLRLHATYRHDLKIYSSDEGRVQMTAAAFAKGFLDLEGRLTPILASLVSKHKSITKMLDETPAEGRARMEASKAIINSVLTSERPMSSDEELIAATRLSSGSGGENARSADASTNPTPLPPAYLGSAPGIDPAADAADADAPVPATSPIALNTSPRSASPAKEANSAANVFPPPSAAPTPAAAALPPSAAATTHSHGTAAKTIPPAHKKALLKFQQQFPPSAVLSPLIDAIEAGDCSLLREAELSLRQLGKPLETLHQLHRLVDTLTAELRDRATLARNLLAQRLAKRGVTSERVSGCELSPLIDQAPPPSPPPLPGAASSLPPPLLPDLTPGLGGWADGIAAGENLGPVESPQRAAPAAPAPGEATTTAAAEVTTADESDDEYSSAMPLEPANGETVLLQYGRWAKLKREFYKPKKMAFDTTKIPDLYDNAMYDMLHNQHLQLAALPALYATARALASYVVPQEYGADPEDKERIHQLDHSVSTDVRTPRRHVRTRLYFTSESHIHSMFNVLRWGAGTVTPGEPSIFTDEAHTKFHQIELGYLTHIVFRILLKRGKDQDHHDSYAVQVLVSPGMDHHDIVCDAALQHEQWATSAGGANSEASRNLFEALSYARLPIIASSPDLSLEEVDSFLAALEGISIADSTDAVPETRSGTAEPTVGSERGSRESSRVHRLSTAGGYRSGTEEAAAAAGAAVGVRPPQLAKSQSEPAPHVPHGTSERSPDEGSSSGGNISPMRLA